MNAGLTNLATLKAWLLPGGMVDGTDYNAQILAIGTGVVGMIETYCNRKFARLEDDTYEISGDRAHLIVPRFPIEEVSSIELRESLAGGWQDQGDIDVLVRQVAGRAGLIDFGTIFAGSGTRLRVTFTGGYWWNQQEPDYTPPEEPTEEDPDLSLKPDAAALVPDDLLLAWRLQCEWVWTKRDILGLRIGEKQDNVFGGSLAKVVLLDGVKEILNPYKRYALT